MECLENKVIPFESPLFLTNGSRGTKICIYSFRRMELLFTMSKSTEKEKSKAQQKK